MKHNYVEKWTVYELSAIQKSAFFEKSPVFFIKQFLHTFCQKRTFCYPTTFFWIADNSQTVRFWGKLYLI